MKQAQIGGALASPVSRPAAWDRAGKPGRGKALAALVFGLCLLALPQARAAETVTFQIFDQLGITEVEESTAIYIDEHLVGAFHLDSTTQEQSVTVTLPRAASYQYVMCGRVSTRQPDGQISYHEVNTSGLLHEVDGRAFEAVTDNFERYFIRDRGNDAMPADVQTNTGRRCTPAVS